MPNVWKCYEFIPTYKEKGIRKGGFYFVKESDVKQDKA